MMQPMLINEPFRWTQPGTWPWMVWVWLAFFAAAQVKPLWKRFQRSRAQSWPVVQGRIERATVEQKRVLLGLERSNGPMFTAIIRYSYAMGADSYVGFRKQDFGNEEEGLEYVRDLGGRSVSIAVNPSKPAESQLLDEAIAVAQSSRAPSPLLARPQEQVSAWLKPLLWPVIILALAGFAVSLCVNLAALQKRELLPQAYFFLLHLGIFVVWIPAVIVANKRAKRAGSRDLWKAVLNGPSAWMRYVLYGLFAYGAVIGFSVFGNQLGKLGSRQDPYMEWFGFSSTWMIFYFAAFAILYSSVRPAEDTPLQGRQN